MSKLGRRLRAQMDSIFYVFSPKRSALPKHSSRSKGGREDLVASSLPKHSSGAKRKDNYSYRLPKHSSGAKREEGRQLPKHGGKSKSRATYDPILQKKSFRVRFRQNYPHLGIRLLESLGIIFISSVPLGAAMWLLDLQMSIVVYAIVTFGPAVLFFVLNWCALRFHLRKARDLGAYCRVNLVCVVVQGALSSILFRLADAHRFADTDFYKSLFTLFFGFTKAFRVFDAFDAGGTSRHILSFFLFWVLYLIEILLLPYFVTFDETSLSLEEQKDDYEN